MQWLLRIRLFITKKLGLLKYCNKQKVVETHFLLFKRSKYLIIILPENLLEKKNAQKKPSVFFNRNRIIICDDIFSF